MRVSLSVVVNNCVVYSSIFQVFGLLFFIFPPETAFRVGALSVRLCFQKLCLFVCVYELRFNSPCSYRQPNGNGQLLSRRYCTHSVCCSRALLVRPYSPKALWRFRVSTSNSLSGRSWPHTHTHIRYIYQTYAQQDIRVYEDDHLKPLIVAVSNSQGALASSRKYLSISR